MSAMFDLNLLRVFEAMLVEQNVTAAAAHVGLTQSAMSNALGRLRLQFGDPLFVKTRTGMLPTPRALQLAAPLKEALALVRSSTEELESFDPLTSERVFRLYMTDVGGMRFLPPLMKHLLGMGAKVKVETLQVDVEELSDRMTLGEVDLALGFLPRLTAAIERTSLYNEHYVCLTRVTDADDGAKLTLKKFLQARHVAIDSMGSGLQFFDEALERQGIRRDIALRVPHFAVIPMILAETDLVVTLPSRVASGIARAAKVREHQLPFKFASFDVSLFWHPRFASDPPILWLRNLLTRLFQEEPYQARVAGKRNAARTKDNGHGQQR